MSKTLQLELIAGAYSNPISIEKIDQILTSRIYENAEQELVKTTDDASMLALLESACDTQGKMLVKVPEDQKEKIWYHACEKGFP